LLRQSPDRSASDEFDGGSVVGAFSSEAAVIEALDAGEEHVLPWLLVANALLAAAVLVLCTVLYGHFLIPSLRQALFIAVAEIPSVVAASCKGSAKSFRRVVSFKTTGLEFKRAC